MSIRFIPGFIAAVAAMNCATHCAAAHLATVSAANEHASVISTKDIATDLPVYAIRFRDTSVRVVPDAGCNAYSINVAGTEFLRGTDDLTKLKGVSYGTPILYPMPNRVRGARFSYGGRTYEFPSNGNANFIHGLVHSVAWRVTAARADKDFAELTCELSIDENSEVYERFPFQHILTVSIRVSDRQVRWTYGVQNLGELTIPFGFALHPYFNYLGKREQTYLQVRCESLMEAEQQLPSGKLLNLDGHPLDAREPVSLAGYSADHVFFGLQHNPAAVVEFRDAGRKISFVTSDEFTHLVVYTPNQSFFCIENQTCSTDAHNLASQGHNDVAHLQECSPGKTMQGWVECRFE